MLPKEIEAKYELLGTLGSGAMGTVLDARDRKIRRRVAVKVVRRPAADDPEGAEADERFRREAEAAGRLSHPNIVTIHDYGEDDTSAWIVMELVEGGSLKARLDRHERFALPELVRLMDQILAALAYSHARDVVHRDIKPANIMLAADGTVKLADFGIARLVDSSMTQVGTVMGTPAYMAPEQFLGEAVDARADLWAAGVVLYQLLTGEKPFDGGFAAVRQRVLTADPLPPSQLSVTAPRAFDAVIARALARRPADRFQTAAALAEAIRSAAASDATVALSGGAGGLGADAEMTMVAGAGATLAPTLGPGVGATLPPGAAAATLPPRAAPPPPPRRRLPVGLIAGAGAALVAGAVGAWLVLAPAEQGGTGPGTLASGPGTAGPTAPPAEPSRPVPTLVPAPPPAELVRPAPSLIPAPPPAEPAQPSPSPVPVPLPIQPPQPAPLPVQPPQAASPVAPPGRPALPAPVPPGQRLADYRAAASAAAAAEPCSLLAWTASDALVSIAGPIRRGAEPAVLGALRARGVPEEAIRLRLEPFDGPYCGVLEAIRPVVAQAEAPPRADILGTQPLQKGDLLRMTVAMPNYPSQVYVAYLMKSGEVAHLVASRAEAANGVVRLGDRRPGFPGWEVDEPFGTDLVLIFASDRPIFPQRRPVIEKIDDYAAALRTQLEALRGQGARVAARVLSLETVLQR